MLDMQTQKNEQLAHIAQGTVVIFAATGFGLGLNFLYNIVLARVLGATDYGLYALGLATFNLLSVFALAGLDSAVLRFLPACSGQGKEGEAILAVHIHILLSLLFGSIFGFVLWVGAASVAGALFDKSALIPVLLILAVGIPAFTGSSVLVAMLQVLHDVKWRTTIKYVCEPLAKILLTMILFWLGWSIEGAAVAFVAALVLSVVLALVPLRHFFTSEVSRSSGGISYSEVLKFSLPVWGGLLFNIIAVKSDVLLLGYWAPASEVGIYSIAFQTSAIIALILGSLESIAIPLLGHGVVQADLSRVEKVLQIILRWSLTISLPLFLVMSLFAQDIVLLFGKAFEHGALCLAILAIGQIINAATATTHNVLLLAGFSRVIMWNSLITGLAQVGLNLLLIPKFGAIGAAVGTTAGLVLVNVVRLVESRILLGLCAHKWLIWKPLAAALGAAVIVMTLKVSAPALDVPALVCVLVIAYVACLVMLGLESDDQLVLMQFRAKVRRYVECLIG